MMSGRAICLLLLLTMMSGLRAFAVVDDKQDHPYQVILDRNPFGLRPPEPPPTNAPPAPPPSNLKLTGIATLLTQPRAYLMALAPGKPKPEYYDFAVGEGKDGIEVLEIDEAAGSVKIKNGGTPAVLTFAANGIAPVSATPTAAAPQIQGAAPTVQNRPAGGTPSTVVQVATAGTGGTPGVPVNNTVVSTVNPALPGRQPYVSTPAPMSPGTMPTPPVDYSGGTRSIPSRTLRVPPPGADPGSGMSAEMRARYGLGGDQMVGGNPASPGAGGQQKQLSVEEQIVLIELQREANKGKLMPPLPPTPLTPGNQ